MTGHFEKGRWISDGLIIAPQEIPLCITFDGNFPCSVQIDRVAQLLNLESLPPDELHGEMIIKGASGKWYRILDFWEYLLKRMK